MSSLRRHLDWWFKDLTVRKGGYVIGENFNRPLIIFTISIILAVIVWPGFWQFTFALIAYLAMTWWGVLEIWKGRSRFRKLLGILALLAVAGAVILRLGL
jgi:hypothetical protein